MSETLGEPKLRRIYKQPSKTYKTEKHIVFNDSTFSKFIDTAWV